MSSAMGLISRSAALVAALIACSANTQLPVEDAPFFTSSDYVMFEMPRMADMQVAMT